MSSSTNPQITPVELIERRIHVIRDQKVMLDSDLAELYDVATKNLNKAVQRNIERFPADFMLRLTKQEVATLRFQIGTSKTGRGGAVTCRPPLPSKVIPTRLGSRRTSDLIRGEGWYDP